ncbi:hypothetical protein [Castellaniella sp. UC4442_H9]
MKPRDLCRWRPPLWSGYRPMRGAWNLAALLLAATCCLAGSAWAQPAGTQPAEDWETQSVRDLMRQDLQRALNDAARLGPTTGSSGSRAVPAPVRPLLAPRLVALYGVGRALMAEVQVGRDSFLYVRGQAYPAGYSGDRTVYQLRGMNGACVQLERGEDRHSLCLRMLLGEVQP